MDWGSSKIKEILFFSLFQLGFKLIEKQLFCLLSRQTNDNIGDYFSDFWQLWNASKPW